jgi:hypothetical protein
MMRWVLFFVGVVLVGAILKYIQYPDSLFACIAIVIAGLVIRDMLKMCDRLLDPPSPVFMIFVSKKGNEFH